MLRKEIFYFLLHKEPIWLDIWKADVYIVIAHLNGRGHKVEAHEKQEAIQNMINRIEEQHFKR